MSYSTLNLYKDSLIRPEKNFMVEDIATYLNNFNYMKRKTITEFQYIKHSLELKIKIDTAQYGLEFVASENWDYCSIQNLNELAKPTKKVYYFIVGKEWKGESTIELSLYMDTLNTFGYGVDYKLSEKTKVMREHKDRYKLIKQENHYQELLPMTYITSSYTGIVISTYALNDGKLFVVKIPLNIDTTSMTDKNSLHIEFKDDNNFGSAYNSYEMKVMSYFISNDVSGDIYLQIYVKGLVGGLNSDLRFYLRATYTTDYITNLVRNIDYFNEGLNPILYKKDETEIHQDLKVDMSWNVVYKGSSIPDCYLIPENPIPSKQSATSPDFQISYSDLTENNYYLVQYGYNSPESFARQNWYDLIPIPKSNIIIEANGIQYIPSYQSTLGYKRIHEGYALFRPTGHNYLEIYYVKQELNAWTGLWEKTIRLVNTGLNNVKILNCPTKVYYYQNTSIPNSYTNSTGNWNFTPTQENKMLNDIGQIDRTESTLIKIIKIPYCPTSYTYTDTNGIQLDQSRWMYDSSYNAFKLIDLNSELSTTIKTDMDDFILDTLFASKDTFLLFDGGVGCYKDSPKNIYFESKLFHSSFYQKKFVYDSFSFVFQYEKIDESANLISSEQLAELPSPNIYKFSFEFTMTGTINSKFMFKFPTYKLKHSEEDYDNVMPIARNNEVVIYNSDYITYLRTAYNYDIKAKERTEKLAGVNFAVQTGVGAIKAGAMTLLKGSAGAMSWGGVFASTITGITQLTNTIAQAEDSVERKIASMKAQGVSVAGSDDIDLLVNYSNNKAKICTYQASDRVREMLFELFYYTGYATGEMKIPNLTTRLWFNFIQADIVYKENIANIPKNLLDNIAERFAGGITYLHKVMNDTTPLWDFDQHYENWENTLVDYLELDFD